MDILMVRLASVAASFRLALDTSGKKTLDRDNEPFCKEPANIQVPIAHAHSLTLPRPSNKSVHVKQTGMAEPKQAEGPAHPRI
jgi:hypothetical protein